MTSHVTGYTHVTHPQVQYNGPGDAQVPGIKDALREVMMTNTTNSKATEKVIAVNAITFTNASGDKIKISLTDRPRKVKQSETGPAYRVQGVAEFVSGPCFDKYGSHRTPVDFGMSAADALAWHMAWFGACA